MIINPRIAIERGWIKGNISEDNIQPNGIDFTVDALYQLDPLKRSFELSPTGKTHATWEPVQLLDFYHKDDKQRHPSWFLEPQSMYDFQSDMRVTLPAEGVSALLVTRSTLNRNGLVLTSGWYDSGFDGQISALIKTSQVRATIAKGTRIGQIIFMESDAAKEYDGQYQGIKGRWTEGV